jgi:hypothetical protein
MIESKNINFLFYALEINWEHLKVHFYTNIISQDPFRNRGKFAKLKKLMKNITNAKVNPATANIKYAILVDVKSAYVAKSMSFLETDNTQIIVRP